MSLVFEHVYAENNGYTILHDIHTALTESRVAIVGNNGSGKSTLARCACGLHPIRHAIRKSSRHLGHSSTHPSSDSRILVHGKSLKELKKDVWKSINMCFQIPDQQIIMPNVKDELELGLKHRGWDEKKREEKIDFALSVLQVSPDHACHFLSEGQKRMLSLLSILLLEPKTIILDEPTTFLDMPAKYKIMDFISTLSQQVIIISHDLFLIEEFSRVLCIHDGRIHCDAGYKETIKEYKKLW